MRGQLEREILSMLGGIWKTKNQSRGRVRHKANLPATSLVVLHSTPTLPMWGPNFDSWWGTKSHMLQIAFPHAARKDQRSRMMQVWPATAKYIHTYIQNKIKCPCPSGLFATLFSYCVITGKHLNVIKYALTFKMSIFSGNLLKHQKCLYKHKENVWSYFC